MADSPFLKAKVREKYAGIARKEENPDCCASQPSCCDSEQEMANYSRINEDYSGIAGYHAETDLGLGCGLPTEYAGIQPGETVLDLGSGAGNDAFIARSQAGPAGRVIGIDFTPAMVDKARTNAVKLGFQNVEFQEADIEDLPLADNSIDKVISNCVLNLVPDKRKAYAQIFRVLRPGGGFCISDIVTVGELPDTLRNSIEAYTGCIAGAMQQDEYLYTISSSGFDAVKIARSWQIPLPENSVKSQMTKHQLAMLRSEKNGVYSITVTGRKPEVPGK